MDKTILEQFYLSRKIRIYRDYSPTLRSERFGLLVIEYGKNEWNKLQPTTCSSSSK